MAQSRGDRFSFHNLLKMLIAPSSSNKPAHDESDMAEDLDEPPDHHILHATSMNDDMIFTRPTMVDRKESLLTRALKSSPEMSPIDQHHTSMHDSVYSYRSYPHSNISGISTAELTSDGGLTSPSLSNTPSPPLPPQMMGKAAMAGKKDLTQRVKVVNTNENSVEANLGRKRCISFACGKAQESAQPKVPSPEKTQTTTPQPQKDTLEPPKRKSTLTFACPSRQSVIQRERSPGRKTAFRTRCRGSPAPAVRKTSSSAQVSEEIKAPVTDSPKGVPTSGLGKFEESEATRFHEFASSVDDDDEWVKRETEFTEKITLNDCMKKENAIRRLAEEAAQEEEDEDDDIEDLADDDSTVHDFSSDDGNESDNEAGFADSDESDDDGSDYEFWAPSAAASETNVIAIDIFPPTMERRASNTSFDSMTDDHQKWLPAPVQKIAGRRGATKPIKMRPGTPNLPDSTDFVCGTLDEDRPLEAAYKSCLEQRRISKHVPIPQDIDPSFPTSDPEAEEDLEDLSEDEEGSDAEPVRGRTEAPTRSSPRHSPKRMMSPPPPRAGRTSPKRLKSPPPRARAKSPSPKKWKEMPALESPRGLNISHLVQHRQPLVRTKSLPRTPNPFFATDQSHRWHGIPPLSESPEDEYSRAREVLHTRGPIDIVEGLEKKRQKRKEKFWRQHCRKQAAKEQTTQRKTPGKGAKRMKELGLEVAERCRAYGVAEDTQLVLSV
ncbi:uncharacterized protein N7503_005977 [Penicillium pulvis]|uniref:uncharacterized protein n=1 Tax=Penicillium pulvis TaxID=1562058 RepID=UPI0025480F9D|nr:uncharacterized protein N7503_005977 [Penicillium pulvis]KAJ5803527.1 hypothetical protein N7503_005977 [Penicillium pulvis]